MNFLNDRMAKSRLIVSCLIISFAISSAQKGRSSTRIPDIRPPATRTTYGLSQASHDDSQFVEAARLAHMNVAKSHEEQQKWQSFSTSIPVQTPIPTPYPTPFYLKEEPQKKMDLTLPKMNDYNPPSYTLSSLNTPSYTLSSLNTPSYTSSSLYTTNNNFGFNPNPTCILCRII